MNCKPGDLAIVIKGPIGAFVPTGAIVRCIELAGDGDFLLCYEGREELVNGSTVWVVEWNGNFYGTHGYPLAIPDAELRPIRDPGEDAQDETLSWLPAPHRDEVPA